jgi:thiosulfate reductase cytochrome b subunit
MTMTDKGADDQQDASPVAGSLAAPSMVGPHDSPAATDQNDALTHNAITMAARPEPPTKAADPKSPVRLHPLPLRIMHWINAATMFIMIGSGWKIYNDDVMFGWLHFPEQLTLGKWAQDGLQWHFTGMWFLFISGGAYLTYGLVTGRFYRMLLPVRWRELVATIRNAMRLRLSHDDPTKYNTVQKLLYIGIITVGILTVVSGLAIWKPVRFSVLMMLFGSFQTARLIHFICMTAIVLFVVVHVSLALLVPRTLVTMFTGGPALKR